MSLVTAMKKGPFSIATDGSNDYEDVKLYPLVVCHYDEPNDHVKCLLLCLLESNSSMGQAIYQFMADYMEKHSISWENYLSCGADNANVMSGTGSGVAGHLKHLHPHVYMVGCPCHLIHIAAEKATTVLTVNVEDILVKVWYYLDKAANGKHSLRICSSSIVVKWRRSRNVFTRWLSVGQCTSRLLAQWEALADFFGQENNKGKGKEKKSKPAKNPSSVNSTSSASQSKPTAAANPGTLNISRYLFQQQQCAEKTINQSASSTGKEEKPMVSKAAEILAFFQNPLSKA